MDQVIDTLTDVLALTAWEMEKPKAYGWFHILFMLIGFSLCFFLAWKLRKTGEKGNKAILLTIGIVLVVCEVYKQLLYELVVEPEPGYNWGNFSFQLCSIPMYLALLIPMLKPGRIRKALYGFLVNFNLLGGFVAFFEPSGLFHAHWTLTLHALVWHMLLVFLGAYVAFSGRGCNNIKDYWDTVKTFLILCLMAFGINCAFWQMSEGQIKMFFIGPGNSPIIVFKQISEMFGWYVSMALYIPVVCLGAYLVYLALRVVNQKMNSGAVLQNV